MDEKLEVFFNIGLCILTLLGILILIAVGIYGIGQVGFFIFHAEANTLPYLFRGFIALAIAGGVPLGLTISIET